MREPTPPIELVAPRAPRLATESVAVSDDVARRLAAIAPTLTTSTDSETIADASRDWWPLAMRWALDGFVPQSAAALCRPTTTGQVSAILSVCHHERIPVTAAGGRSGVCGASIPLHGGVLLDLSAMHGVVAVDEVSLVAEVLPGTFGPDLEEHLGRFGLTLGHYPQSFDISTVGGWLACRGAGQYSTRYGKIEDMVVGLEVVLADGRVIRTGGAPRAAAGPDLNQVFVGSEGTLGIITRAWLRLHPAPVCERRAVYGFIDFESGLDACRRIMQRGATPAVLRLYDGPESKRGQGGDGNVCVLLVLDEGDVASVSANMSVVDEECLATAGCLPRDVEAVEKWMHHRNDTSALQALTRKGFVVDTMEITGAWSRLPAIFDAARSALLGVEHARSATCHLSHSYTDGACLYFTFAASPPADEFEKTYNALWDAGTRAILSAGGNLSHHHGVGLNRARFSAEALGSALEVVSAIKDALDPHGILNPGKMGLPDRFATRRTT
ncbi:MAG: FAD-binding oxidoreductase [Acidimicrobiales bacterium mtb01]|nr:FAD-binding oxidoreductase [Actinomycetota bacterium]TEX44921.1 MAG: FAD-binding oxidoreductase [Acidimicrobiales bacterium mtb01]